LQPAAPFFCGEVDNDIACPAEQARTASGVLDRSRAADSQSPAINAARQAVPARRPLGLSTHARRDRSPHNPGRSRYKRDDRHCRPCGVADGGLGAQPSPRAIEETCIRHRTSTEDRALSPLVGGWSYRESASGWPTSRESGATQQVHHHGGRAEIALHGETGSSSEGGTYDGGFSVSDIDSSGSATTHDSRSALARHDAGCGHRVSADSRHATCNALHADEQVAIHEAYTPAGLANGGRGGTSSPPVPTAADGGHVSGSGTEPLEVYKRSAAVTSTTMGHALQLHFTKPATESVVAEALGFNPEPERRHASFAGFDNHLAQVKLGTPSDGACFREGCQPLTHSSQPANYSQAPAGRDGSRPRVAGPPQPNTGQACGWNSSGFYEDAQILGKRGQSSAQTVERSSTPVANQEGQFSWALTHSLAHAGCRDPPNEDRNIDEDWWSVDRDICGTAGGHRSWAWLDGRIGDAVMSPPRVLTP
jgi:hypothetical protein